MGIPEFYATRGVLATCYFGRGGSVHFPNKRRMDSVEKPRDPWKSLYERMCEVWLRSTAYDHQQPNTILNNCVLFVGLVPNPAVMG